MEFSNVETWLRNYFGDSTFILKVFLVVLVTLIANFIWRRFYAKLLRQLQKTKTEWDDASLVSLKRPIAMLIWGIGAWVIINYLFMFPIEAKYRDVYLVALFSWFLVRFIREAEKNLAQSNKNKTAEDKIDH